MSHRPFEALDERILIVGIDEQDIKQIQKYPIPDQEIATLIQTLQKYQPRAISWCLLWLSRKYALM